MIKILYAEDDVKLAKLCVDVLAGQGYQVTHVSDGEKALIEMKREKPDLVLLDIVMPNVTGYQVAKTIREEDASIPILFISSLSATSDIESGFDVGADDYIRKEFMLEEIGVRVKARLRQSGYQLPVARRIPVCENVMLDMLTREFHVNSTIIKLTPIELRLMQTFCLNKDKYVSKEQLLKAGWGNTFKETHSYLNKALSHLRKSLPKDSPVSIGSSWGKGWALIVRDEA